MVAVEEAALTPSAPSLRALDFLNIFLADVRDGVGPYLAIYLLASHHWDPAHIGIAMSVAGLATIVVQTPAGAFVDRTRRKRLVVVVASVLIAVACLSVVIETTLAVVVVAQAAVGVAAAVLGPAVAAITLGLVGHRKLARRIGRNEVFNHAGNVAAAALAGLLGHFVAREYIFYLVAAMSAAAIISVLRIRADEIDHDVARGAADEKREDGRPHITGFGALLNDRRVVAFAVSVVLFHFANAAMLPLVGQVLSAGKARGASLYMSACIIIAQLVMIPMAAYAGRGTQSWGRKPVFLIAFAVLPLRGLLYTLGDNPYYLVGVQSLDGIGAGIFGVVSVIMIADLTRGTGRFNLTQGAIGTAVGIGASLSTLVTGFVVQYAGYDAAFLSLAGVAALALLVFARFVPETRPPGRGSEPRTTPIGTKQPF